MLTRNLTKWNVVCRQYPQCSGGLRKDRTFFWQAASTIGCHAYEWLRGCVTDAESVFLFININLNVTTISCVLIILILMSHCFKSSSICVLVNDSYYLFHFFKLLAPQLVLHQSIYMSVSFSLLSSMYPMPFFSDKFSVACCRVLSLFVCFYITFKNIFQQHFAIWHALPTMLDLSAFCISWSYVGIVAF